MPGPASSPSPADPVRIDALGLAVDLVPDGSQADHLRALLAPHWSWCLRDPEIPAGLVLHLEIDTDPAAVDTSDRLVAASGREMAVKSTQRVTLAGIEHNAGRSLMFHAAGLCHPVTGNAVIAIAPGGIGKTTLCRTLGSALGYLSDETIAIRPDGTISAYPKPLSVRRPQSEVKDEIGPDQAGLLPPPSVARPVAVLFLSRNDHVDQPGRTGSPVFEDLDPFDAILRASPESSSLSKLPRPLHLVHDFFAGLDTLASVSYVEAADLRGPIHDLVGASR